MERFILRPLSLLGFALLWPFFGRSVKKTFDPAKPATLSGAEIIKALKLPR